MHQADLERYVRTLPASTLAALARDGREFSAARTPVPSDSFPGLVAQVTGGNPPPPASTTTIPTIVSRTAT
jgi:hypothetical protein